MYVLYFYSRSKLPVPGYPAYDVTNNRTWGPHTAGAESSRDWWPQDLAYWPTESVWMVPGTVAD
jgi:hypothetical protein